MMRKLLLFLIGLQFLACQSQVSDYTDAISEIKEEFAPDKRVAIWEVEAKVGAPAILVGKTNIPAAKEKFFQRLDSMELSYVDKIEILVPKAGVVSLSVCNIRSQPKHSAELATQCTMGQMLRIYEEADGWFRVQTPDDYLGWLDSGGFYPLTDSEAVAYEKSERVVFLPEYGFAWSAPEETSTPVCDLINGNSFKLLEEGTDFSQIQLPDGKTGYVSSSEIMPYWSWWESRDSMRNASTILEEAKKLLGRPYLWGGTSGKGMDCSGFTKEVYYRNGLILPRDASQQVHIGTEIPTDTTTWAGLLPGDLLFFGRKETEEKSERISHVAIYLGAGRIIHSSGEVKIESLLSEDSDYAADRVASFVRAKRIL